MKTISLFFAISLLSLAAHSQLIISGFLANPSGSDSSYEYVQIIAAENINFATTPYSVVFSNNGTATSDGWIAGSSISYGFNINSGSVVSGDVFYVGGSCQKLAGGTSASLASETWLAMKDVANIDGDGFGTHNNGIVGNGGANADGIAIFSGLTSSLTASSVPVDAVFYGETVGTAMPASGGYVLPDNDHYTTASGTFGHSPNDFLFPDPSGNVFVQIVGSFNLSSDQWVSIRVAELDTLDDNSPVSEITTKITLLSGVGLANIQAEIFSVSQSNSLLMLNNNTDVVGKYSVMSIIGQEVVSGFASPGMNAISLSEIKQGLYLISFYDGQQIASKKLFIK